MNQNRITVRYAKALLNFARDEGKTKEVAEDAYMIFETLQDSPEILHTLRRPGLGTSKKNAILKDIFAAHTTETTQKFLKLLVRNGREAYLKGIFRNYIAFYRKEQGIVDAEITTAVHVQESTLAAIQKKIEDLLKAKVDMNNRIREDILGGFILRFDDKQLDASIATQLSQIKRRFKETGRMN